jgi:hypothetical protein
MVSNDTLAQLLEIVETVAIGSCKMADSDCRTEWPDSPDDWCLVCLARQAKEDYYDEAD